MVWEHAVEEKTLSMLPDLQDFLVKEVKRMLESGVIDFAQYCNDYRLPRILLHTALKRALDQYILADKEARSESIKLLCA